MTAINAFFLTDKNHRDKSDAELKEEAAKLLENWKFTFSKMEGRPVNVSCCLVMQYYQLTCLKSNIWAYSGVDLSSTHLQLIFLLFAVQSIFHPFCGNQSPQWWPCHHCLICMLFFQLRMQNDLTFLTQLECILIL